jgi:hypothetical protein
VLFILGGIASGVGAFATALAAIIPVLASIGLPAIVAALAGIAIVVAEITAVVAVLGLAWQRNFLGIRELVTNAAAAVLAAFGRIRAIFQEATQRILPTLQSLTAKVLGAVTAAWERYGKVVVQIVGDVFAFVTGVTETFLRAFTNFVDLVLKLIDGDWRGAWRAFSRIVIGVMDAIIPTLGRLHRAVVTALATLLAFILAQAVRFVSAAQGLARQFVFAFAAEIALGAPHIRDALFAMLVVAAAGVAVGPIAQALVARLIAEMRRAAGEGLPVPEVGPQVGGDLSRVAGIFNRPARRRGLGTTTTTDTGAGGRGEQRVAREADKLRDAIDKLNEQRIKNRIEDSRTAIDQQFALARDGLDREQRALEASFDDRLKSVRAYFAERARLEEAQVDAEITKEKGLSKVLTDEFIERGRQIAAEFKSALAEVEGDPRLKGQARTTALRRVGIEKETKEAEALGQFEKQNAEVSTRLLVLRKQRADIAGEQLRAEQELTRELKLQRDQLRFDVLDAQGRTAEAEAGRLKAQFTQTLRDLRIDTTGISTALQIALNKVDVGVLKRRLEGLPEPVRLLVELLDIGIKRAQIAEEGTRLDVLNARLQLDETGIQNRVLDGVISQRDAQGQLVTLQRIYRDLLLEVLEAELAKAEAVKDPALVVSLQQQIAEVDRLGIAIDEAGQEINRALFSDLQSGLSGIFTGARKGFEGLRDAAISFGERLLDTLNDIAATSILQRVEDLFKPDATNTEGTIGGFFSRLFGLQSQRATDAAAAAATLQTGAATAAATTATSATVFATAVSTAATTFAGIVTAAASAVAAAFAASSAIGGAGGGLGAALGAATGMFPAVPGGVFKFVEGGFPEAVLTTDPKHAARQVSILRELLRRTRGFGGRIPELAAGAIMSPGELSASLVSGLRGAPMIAGGLGETRLSGERGVNRFRFVLTDERSVADWLNSSEGEQVVQMKLVKNRPLIKDLSR